VKLIDLKEVGPYVYDELRKKVDVQFDASGTTVKYTEVKEYRFNKNLSGPGLEPTDMVTIVHPALVNSKKRKEKIDTDLQFCFRDLQEIT